jgi:chromosome segregation ATPase
MSDLISREAVERLALRLADRCEREFTYDSDCDEAAATLRALSERLAEAEAERDAFQKEAYAASHALKNIREARAAAEARLAEAQSDLNAERAVRVLMKAALATARADALREAAAVSLDFEVDGVCGIQRQTGKMIKDAILALIPKEQTNDH